MQHAALATVLDRVGLQSLPLNPSCVTEAASPGPGHQYLLYTCLTFTNCLVSLRPGGNALNSKPQAAVARLEKDVLDSEKGLRTHFFCLVAENFKLFFSY